METAPLALAPQVAIRGPVRLRVTSSVVGLARGVGILCTPFPTPAELSEGQEW